MRAGDPSGIPPGESSHDIAAGYKRARSRLNIHQLVTCYHSTNLLLTFIWFVHVPSQCTMKTFICVVIVCAFASVNAGFASSYGHGGGDDGGFSGHSGYGGDSGEHSYGGGDDGGHGGHVVSQTVEITKPVAVPVYQHVGVPIPHSVPVPIPKPVAIPVPQPYPVHIHVPQPVAVPVIKTITIPVEKPVPYIVEKSVPYPVEKPVPVHVEKHVQIPVPKPVPVKVPVYKVIYHHSKH